MEMNYKELIKRSYCKRKDQYIDYFFKNIVCTDQKPCIGQDNVLINNPFDIAIVRNSQEKKSHLGNKYIERNWRTCIFYFINKQDAYEYLSDSNKENYRFTPNDENIRWDSTNGFPSSKINIANLDTVNHHVFSYFKKAKSSWFVRSFIYFVLIICDDDSEISFKDFHIHYWNSKYRFAKANKKPLFGKSKSNIFVEDVAGELSLIENENKDSIDCVKAFYGRIDFFPENEEAYVDIKNDIDSGIKYILCQGAARTGKTILAMRFLHDFPDYNLLLMNYNFYLSLKDAFGVLNAKFPSDRIFHHDLKHKSNGCWVSGSISKHYKLDLSHLIVDEAQRLALVEERGIQYGVLSELDEINDIINCKNHAQTLFFGDNSQRLNPRYDQGFDAIKASIGDKDYREYYFSTPLGVPPEIIKNVRFLLGFDNSSPHPINQFSISIQKDETKFIDSYLNDMQRKRHLVIPVIADELHDGITIGNHLFKNIKNKDNPFLLFDSDVQNNYFLTAYSVISREIESVYLYLPKMIHLDDDNQICISGYSDNTFLINHLYTIMTRSTMNLYICCEDEKLGELLSEKIDAIKNEPAKEEDEEIQQLEFDYDVFISYFGTNREDGTYSDAKRVCDILKKQGINVFLYNYSYNDEDKDLKFNETWHVISRSKTLVFVFNEFVEKDSSGLIKRKTSNGEASRIYQELDLFGEKITLGIRKAKTDVRFYYIGKQLNKFTIYPFLNRYIPILTQGNSNCCFMNDNDLIKWINERFKDNE